MRKIIILFLVVINGCHQTDAIQHNEKYYQTQLCQQLNGTIEYKLPDATRVDCLTQQYAIEVDWGKKWAEGIGQALYYAEITQKKPAVALIINDNEKRFLKRLKRVAKKHDITIFVIKK